MAHYDVEKAIEQIKLFDTIIIHRHSSPDGDAIGSCTALYHFLRMCGKDSVRIILNDRHPAYLNFLTSEICQEDIILYQQTRATADILIQDSDLIFCLDFNAFLNTGTDKKKARI